MEVPVLNKNGQQVGTMRVDEHALGGEVIPALLKQAFVRYHANLRQGSARTKNRSRVEGSTRKLYRQKGTGNARAGSIRAVLRRGSGVAFAKLKEREDYRLDMPVKMRRKANRNALLAKLIDNEVRVIDDLSFGEPRTKSFKALLEALKVDRSCLAALAPENANGRMSARNIEGVTVVSSRALNAFDMLNHRYMVISKSCLEAWLSGPSSKTDKSAKSAVQAKKGAR
ncbi:MAG: 50S ribosomal protein L4 [Phycisphaerales bacterium]|nr:50S ribosomal protein L4 [Phycisphaerales bacterium]